MHPVARRPIRQRLRDWLIARAMAPINIGGDSVDSITIDGQDVQEVTVDGDTVYQQSAISDSEIDYFNDTDFSEWSTANGSIFSQTTGTVIEGSGAAVGGNNDRIASTSGLPNYPSQDKRFVYSVQFGADGNDLYCGFGYSDTDNLYQIRLVDGSPGNFTLRKYDGGTATDLDSVSRNFTSGVWRDIEVAEWGSSDGSITINLRESDGSAEPDGTILETLTATDTTHTSGGVTLYSRTGTNYFDYLRTV